MREEQKGRSAEERETRAIARARALRSRKRKERERERKSTRRISLSPFFFFSSLNKGVVVRLTFSLFFAQIFLGAQIDEALESFTKREIPQRYKI